MHVIETPPSQILNRGKRFFDKNNGKDSERVMQQTDFSGTDDLGITARLIYGHLISNMRILSAVETSYVLIAGLISQDVR